VKSGGKGNGVNLSGDEGRGSERERHAAKQSSRAVTTSTLSLFNFLTYY